jgi:RND family efflux transporter MFP subunit
MSADKAELLQSLRIERPDAVPKPTPRRRWPVRIAVVVALVAVVAPLGLFVMPSSVYRQFAVPSSLSGQFASLSGQFAWLSGQFASLSGQFASLFSHDRQGAGASATLASPAPPPVPPPAAAEPQGSPGLVASGYVIARRKATVAAQVTGKVVEVLVHEGMMVKKGDVLARLDSVLPERDLAVAHSKADTAEAWIGAVDADLQDADRQMNRDLRLPLGQAVTVAEVTRSQAWAASLRALLKQAQAAFQATKQDEKHAAEVLDQYTIHAPFDGIVVATEAQPGEVISPLSVGGFTRTGICTLVDMNSLEVDVDVNESFIGRVHPGMPVSAVLDAYPDWTIPGSVTGIVPEANREKGTVQVRIALKKKDPRVLPGMSVKVSFEDVKAATGTSLEKTAAAN